MIRGQEEKKIDNNRKQEKFQDPGCLKEGYLYGLNALFYKTKLGILIKNVMYIGLATCVFSVAKNAILS